MARHEITFNRVVYERPGMRNVPVRRDIEYAQSDAGPLTLDLYDPPDAVGGRPRPAVVIVGGYPDVGVPLTLGCPSKDMEMVISWAQLLAASGLMAVSYTKQDPTRDLRRLVEFLHRNAATLHVDAGRLAVWAASGNVPVALSALMEDSDLEIACAVLCYGFTLDSPASTAVAEASATWKFANPTAGRTVANLKSTVPLFLTRAGADGFAGLNEALDRFICDALARNLPLTIVNARQAAHAFDLFEANDSSRHIVELIVGFLQHHLTHSG